MSLSPTDQESVMEMWMLCPGELVRRWRCVRECEGRGPRIFTQSWKGTHLPVEAMNDPRTCSCYMYLGPPRNHERDYLRGCLYACRRVRACILKRYTCMYYITIRVCKPTLHGNDDLRDRWNPLQQYPIYEAHHSKRSYQRHK